MLPLLLFLDKPLHIDDPVYVQVAQQVLLDPADFYGRELNWSGSTAPLAVEMQNPPLAGFALAAGGAWLGFDERALHERVLIASLATAASLALIAHLLEIPVAAAVLLGCWSPVLFVSSTTLMAEPWLLATFTGAVAAWLYGHATSRARWLWLSGALAALSFLAKFPGIALVPLLFVHGLWRRRRLGGWALPLLVPLGVALGYELYVQSLYGVAPFAQAAGYAQSRRAHGGASALERSVVGLAFLGGLQLPAALLSCLCAGRRSAARWAGIAAALALGLLVAGGITSLAVRDADGIRILSLCTSALFLAAGMQILWLCARELWLRRDAATALLSLWIAGFFLYAVAFNWTINARAFAPAAPAVALLAARAWTERCSRGGGAARGYTRALLAGSCAASLALSLALAHADRAHARTAQRAARELTKRYANPDREVWFLGAWGFQHYAENSGAHKVDRGRTLLQPGAVLIVSRGDLGRLRAPPERLARVIESAAYPAACCVATMAASLGAGFYSELSGPLPYAFGRAAAERYDVLEIRAALRLPAQPDRRELDARRRRSRD